MFPHDESSFYGNRIVTSRSREATTNNRKNSVTVARNERQRIVSARVSAMPQKQAHTFTSFFRLPLTCQRSSQSVANC